MWHTQRKRVSLRVMVYLKEDIAEQQAQLDSGTRAGRVGGTGRASGTGGTG